MAAGLEVTKQAQHHLAAASEDKGPPIHKFDGNVDHFVDKRKCSVCFIIKDRCFNWPFFLTRKQGNASNNTIIQYTSYWIDCVLFCIDDRCFKWVLIWDVTDHAVATLPDISAVIKRIIDYNLFILLIWSFFLKGKQGKASNNTMIQYTSSWIDRV